MNKLIMTAGVLGVATGGVLLAGLAGRTSAPESIHTYKTSKAPVTLKPHVPEQSTPGVSLPRRCTYDVGTMASYAFHGEDDASLSLAAFGLGSGTAKATEVRATLTATLDTKVLESSEDMTLMLARWRLFESSAMRKDHLMTRPFLFQLGPDCQLQGYAYHKALPLEYARVQQSLLHDLSFRIPDVQGESFEGTDTLGAYRSTLSSRTDRLGLHIEKEGLTFKPWRRGLGSVHQANVAVLKVTLSHEGWFKSATLRATYSGTGVTSHRTLRATLLTTAAKIKGASRVQSDYVWADLLPQELPMQEGDVISKSELRARSAIRGEKVEVILDRLNERVSGNGGIHTTWPELRTYLEARPKAVHEVVHKLQQREVPAKATMSVYMALGNTRTPEAKQALEGIMRDETAPTFERVRAIFSLVDRDDVGDDLAIYLAQKSAPLSHSETKGEHMLARHSVLALGMMSGRKPKSESIKKLAVRTVTQALASAPNSIVASPAYGALANIGDPALLTLVANIADHPDFSWREVAAIVTRRMPPQETAEFTRQWLEQEDDWRVKRTIYDILEQQTFSARAMTSREVLALALKDLKQKPGALSRQALVRLLGRAMSDMDHDDLMHQDIEDTFASMIPYEVEHRTGLYKTMARHVSPLRLREVLLGVPMTQDTPTHSPTIPTTSAPTSMRPVASAPGSAP